MADRACSRSGWRSPDPGSATAPRPIKAELAKRICRALRVHTQIEEEVFYPAFLAAATP